MSKLTARHLAEVQDSTLVTLTSQADPSVSTTAEFVSTTERQTSLSLTAAESRLKGKPGETIEYELTVTNMSNTVDTLRVDALHSGN